jgi:hypothetical protein
MKKYINNKELYCEILVSKAQGKLTRSAEKMLELIVKNIIVKFTYKEPEWKKDCMQEAYYIVYKNWHNFNEEKSDNAFAYFSEVVKRGLATGFKKVSKNYESTISMNGIYENGGDMNI